MKTLISFLTLLKFINFNFGGSSTVSSTTSDGTTMSEVIQLKCGIQVNALTLPDGKIQIQLSRITLKGVECKSTEFFPVEVV